MIFYRSIWASIALLGLSKLLEGKYIDSRIKKRRKALLEGFRDLLYAMSSSLASGHQMPRAVKDAAGELRAVHGEDSDIYREVRRMSLAYDSSRAELAALWTDLGERSGLWEIQQFASSYRICQRSGGNMEAACMGCARLLLDKLDLQREMDALTAQSRLDVVILGAIPVVILVFLNLFSYSYISLLYECLAGRMIMTAALALMGGAVYWSAKLLELEL